MSVYFYDLPDHKALYVILMYFTHACFYRGNAAAAAVSPPVRQDEEEEEEEMQEEEEEEETPEEFEDAIPFRDGSDDDDDDDDVACDGQGKPAVFSPSALVALFSLLFI